ncbi:MAG: hypothetical protein AB7E65_03745 [Syntrophotalea sp.]|uniref:hypothetical protein n=1 Tax=Syntrophotalea sp. TaxID=2812029 RepID=UPI003D0D5301
MSANRTAEGGSSISPPRHGGSAASAVSIKARSKPCVLKHFRGALDAGATVQELAYILALVMREAAGANDCWTHDVLSDWQEIVAGNMACGCPA